MTSKELFQALNDAGLDFDVRHEFDGSILISFDVCEDEETEENENV
jgi:hypothetical protein